MTESRAAAPATPTRRPHVVTPVDWFMLALAVASVGLLVFVFVRPVSAETEQRVFLIDTVICGIFALEFLARWRKHGWQRSFIARNWYEILGMIPVSHPALRGFRLIRIVVLVVRVARATDRVLGERFTYRLVESLSRPIVMAIKKPITIAVLDEVVDVLETGNYPQNLALSLRENQDELRAIVAEKLREDQLTGRLRRLPLHDQVVEGVIDTVFRVVESVLTDPRIDAFFAHVVAENRAQIREAVKEGLHERL